MKNKGLVTRQDIISKSLNIFSVKGYFNTSINDILEATGLTKGGLYGHFQSKEAIWAAAYNEAATIWRDIVFRNIDKIENPLDKIESVIENDMRVYLGKEVFPGGCFFLNMLVELSGQSDEMKNRILRGFQLLERRIASWLKEAEQTGLLIPGLDHKEMGKYIVIALNGAAALYAATKDPLVWKSTVNQLRVYLRNFRTAGSDASWENKNA